MNTPSPRLFVTASVLCAVLTAGCQPKSDTASDAPTPPPSVALSGERPPVAPAGGVVVSYADTVKIAAPAVVNIYTTEAVRPQSHPFMNDPFFRRFFEGHGGMNSRQESRAGLGSGVIVSTDGYILTNNHVVSQAGEIVVALQDGRKAKAKLIGTDPESDLAVIRVDLKDLPTLAFRTAPGEVGDVVLAIGNPFGVGQTVTQGIISALGRNGLGINTYEDFIQTDAAINPGNSGGALVDVAGNLVGINTAIYSRSGGSLGIGFAIPAKLAQQVMLEIIQHGQVIRGWLGIEVAQSNGGFNPDGSFDKTPSQGVAIAGVVRGGPADTGGLRPGDLIMSIDGQAVTEAGQLINRIGGIKPDTRVDLLVKRADKELKMAVTVGKRPRAEAAAEE